MALKLAGLEHTEAIRSPPMVVVLVHGGAWAIPEALCEASVNGVKKAARAGFAVLEGGGNALDAVETAVRAMEDDPLFNAGHGAALNTNGEVELDALIMDGGSLAAGAVSSVRNISNPVTLARAVMEKTELVLMTGEGTNRLAESIGIPRVPTSALVTEDEKKRWESYKKYEVGVKDLFNSQLGQDTVGAVALDSSGNLACANSTGGIRNKMVGRVGESPLIGSGGYADNQTGAVSCTGHGESIMKVNLARLIVLHMEQGRALADAMETSLRYMRDRVHGGGGAIAVDPNGGWAARFTTERMAWAAIKGGMMFYGVNSGDLDQEKLHE